MVIPKSRLFWGTLALSFSVHAAVSRLPWAKLTPPPSTLSATQRLSEEEEALSSISIAPLPTRSHLTHMGLNADSVVMSPPQPNLVSTTPEALPASEEIDTDILLEPWEKREKGVETLAPALEDVPVPDHFAPTESPADTPDLEGPLPEAAPSETDSSAAGDTDRTASETSADEQPTPDQGVLLQLAEDFPHVPGAESGCYGLNNCHRSNGGYRQVVKQLTEQLRAQGYTLTEKEDIDGTGRRVFEVVMPSEPESTYYLNVFSDGLDSAVYALTVNILSLEELEKLNV